MSRARELRRAGLTAAQMARERGLTKPRCSPYCARWPPRSAPSVPDRPLPHPAARELVGCWISPGWSAGLGLDDASEWAATDPQGAGDPTTGGPAAVMVAHRRPVQQGPLVRIPRGRVLRRGEEHPGPADRRFQRCPGHTFFSGFPTGPVPPTDWSSTSSRVPRPTPRPWASTRMRRSPTSSRTSARRPARAHPVRPRRRPGTSPRPPRQRQRSPGGRFNRRKGVRLRPAADTLLNPWRGSVLRPGPDGGCEVGRQRPPTD